LVHQIVYLVRLLVISLIRCSGKQPIFIVRVLELLRVDFSFFTSPSLSFTVHAVSKGDRIPK
jgi:K+-sensing histidine kinase KdpD